MLPFAFALPWLALLIFVCFVVRIPRELPGAETAAGRGPADDVPRVSVIVPARNEAINIIGCLRSITSSEYPDFEVIVVDDRSDDHTGELARSVPRGRAQRVLVVDGEPLPDGWLGKPWACHQAVQHATGDLLLFTDADTTHGPTLMGRSGAGLEEEGADLLTVAGQQLMETFWERLVQPQIFLLMLIRFPDFERVARNGRWRDAIANGQFLLFRRSAYEGIGGHVAVKDEVAEDLALAQHVKRAGFQLRVRSARTDLATRMYRSLGQLIEGWSKNIVMGGLQAFPAWFRPVVPPISVIGGFVLWLAAPLVLFVAGTGLGAGTVPADVVHAAVRWAATVYVLSAALWAYFSREMGAPFYYGLLYPLGALVGSYIFLRAWIRGRTVEWKGRIYRLRPLAERA